jgi:hypothetical protein
MATISAHSKKAAADPAPFEDANFRSFDVDLENVDLDIGRDQIVQFVRRKSYGHVLASVNDRTLGAVFVLEKRDDANIIGDTSLAGCNIA